MKRPRTQAGTREDSRQLSAEQRLNELGIQLLAPPQLFGIYAEAVQTGNLLFLTWHASHGRPRRKIRWARRFGARFVGGAESGSPRGVQQPRPGAGIFGITRQIHSDRPARRVTGHFGRFPRPTESC
jgi:hypothetical protein